MSRKAYVVGAKISTGGAYMAYHIGRLLTRHFGYDLIDVHIYDTHEPLFEYDTPMVTMHAAQMERQITPDDVLVVNPSYSQFLYGLRLPGKKIMYVQDFRTFLLLDCHCDLYVSVSSLVARYVQALYGIATNVIPAFIDTHGAAVVPWESRPKGSALVYIKNPSREHQILLELLKQQLGQTAPHIDLSRVIEGRGMKHAEFLHALGSVRYLVNLSLAEGFGLVPLEAMAMGTAVTGVDGLGGADFICNGENALTASIKDLRALPEMITRMFDDDSFAQNCVQAGRETAALHTQPAFEKAWLPELATLLDRAPDA